MSVRRWPRIAAISVLRSRPIAGIVTDVAGSERSARAWCEKFRAEWPREGHWEADRRAEKYRKSARAHRSRRVRCSREERTLIQTHSYRTLTDTLLYCTLAKSYYRVTLSGVRSRAWCRVFSRRAEVSSGRSPVTCQSGVKQCAVTAGKRKPGERGRGRE